MLQNWYALSDRIEIRGVEESATLSLEELVEFEAETGIVLPVLYKGF